MSTVFSSQPSSFAETRQPSLRLLERPQRGQVASPVVEQETLGEWCVRQVERFWAWGENAHHHRMGSWLQH